MIKIRTIRRLLPATVAAVVLSLVLGALAAPASAAGATAAVSVASTTRVTATTPSTSTTTPRPAAPQVAPGTAAGPARSLPAPNLGKLPKGVKALGLVRPGQALQSATLQGSASQTVTVAGPYLIQPFTDLYDAADAYYQNNPTFAWLYSENDTAAQRWYIASAYNIDGYTGSAIYANYGGNLMCMNVRGNVYEKGTQIWVSSCRYGLQLNELWEISAYLVNGVEMDTICSSFDTGLCINVSGGIQTGNLLIIWDLGQLWHNSLWRLFNA